MAGTDIIRKISTINVAWAAGFMEGEGSFYCNNGAGIVTAAQVQREPLDRLQVLFGGIIRQRQTKGFSEKPIWVWTLPSHRSIEVMMTLYVLMSPKRKKQIATALERWKRARIMKRRGTGICARGHELTGYNAMSVKGKKYIRCRECINWRKREARRLA